MAAGDSVLTAAQTRAQYVVPNSALTGQAFSVLLDIAKGNANILSQLRGPEGSGCALAERTDLKAVGKSRAWFNVAAALGAAARRGNELMVNYEEGLHHNAWPVDIDSVRHAIGWSELTRWAATTGASWQEIYPTAIGDLAGRTEQEDHLIRFRMRSGRQNTIRPGRATSLNTLTYSDQVDTATLGRAHGTLTINGAMPAKIGKMTGGMDLKKYICLGSNLQFEGLWNDPTFTNALNHSALDGPMNPYWTNDLPDWRGMIMKRWDVQNFDTAGAIASSVCPQAILGDAITTATTAFTMYGGGITQTTLANEATIYKPFEYFYGCDKRFGQNISVGTDSNVYYFVVIDPADGLWNLFSYVGSDIGANGHHILIQSRLGPSSDTGVRFTTIKTDGFGGSGTIIWTYDTAYNKTAFPTGSVIVQVSPYITPVCDAYLFGQDVGAVCYGNVRDQPIDNKNDYGALNGKGLWTIYGSDISTDSQGLYHRRFARIQSTYEHPLGTLLPQIDRLS